MTEPEHIKTISIEQYSIEQLSELLPDGLLNGINSNNYEITDDDVNLAQRNFFEAKPPTPLTEEEINKLYKTIGPYHFLHLKESTEQLRSYISTNHTKKLRKNE